MSWGRHTEFTSAAEEAALCDDEKETHASTLDKLLAWEKKLYEEVKVGEVIRIKLERKSVQLKKLKKREQSSMTLSKTKAVVKSLQTKYLVEVQAVDAASSEVEKLRDECLRTQLVDLVQKRIFYGVDEKGWIVLDSRGNLVIHDFKSLFIIHWPTGMVTTMSWRKVTHADKDVVINRIHEQ